MPITNTWQRRLTGANTWVHRAAITVGLTSCSVVAIATIWGWIFNDPIDVSGPARTAVNRTELIGNFAKHCVELALTATTSQQQSLHSCWSLRDPVRLPTTPGAVIDSPGISAITLEHDIGIAQHWSVVISVFERPYPSAAPREKCYRIPVLYSGYGLRATLRPSAANCVGPGADAPLDYPATLPATSPLFATVKGFIDSYLTAAGGLERYVTTDSGLIPIGDYRSAQIIKLVASRAVPDQGVPAEATTVHVIATVNSITSQFAPRQEDYPLRLTVSSGRWTVSGLDYAPLLAAAGELTPVIPTPAADGPR